LVVSAGRASDHLEEPVNRSQKREVLAELVKAGRKDLARQFIRKMAAPNDLSAKFVGAALDPQLKSLAAKVADEVMRSGQRDVAEVLRKALNQTLYGHVNGPDPKLGFDKVAQKLYGTGDDYDLIDVGGEEVHRYEAVQRMANMMYDHLSAAIMNMKWSSKQLKV
jgi:hypothetical protein